jgi:hypothetical protein
MQKDILSRIFLITNNFLGTLGVPEPKADVCLLMDVHGAFWTIRSLPTLMISHELGHERLKVVPIYLGT